MSVQQTACQAAAEEECCTTRPPPAKCEDGNACTVADVCEGGKCTPGKLKFCGDQNDCTDDSCNPDMGCFNEFNTAACDDGDMCNGTWGCGPDGYCEMTPAPDCSDWDDGCVQGACHWQTGECYAQGDDSQCKDDDWCTSEWCDGDSGECMSEPNPEGCGGEHHPCQTSWVPGGSNDPGINACVCEEMGLEHCCNEQWDEMCTEVAMDSCGLVCGGCEELDEPLPCGSNADCAQCDDNDLCNGVLSCDEGFCTIDLDTAIVCETDDPDNPCVTATLRHGEWGGAIVHGLSRIHPLGPEHHLHDFCVAL